MAPVKHLQIVADSLEHIWPCSFLNTTFVILVESKTKFETLRRHVCLQNKSKMSGSVIRNLQIELTLSDGERTVADSLIIQGL